MLSELKKVFKPEFLNRVDDIIVFNKLTSDDICRIAGNLLVSLKTRLEGIGITAEFTEEAVKAVAEAGFDELYGARPLKRAIQSKIEDAVSEKILEGTIKAGDKVKCGYADGGFVFDKE